MIDIPSTAIGFDHLEPNLAIQVKKNTEALVKIKQILGIASDPEVPLGYTLHDDNNEPQVYRNLSDQVLHNTQVISDIGMDIQVYVVPLLRRIEELEGQIAEMQGTIDELNALVQQLYDTIDQLNYIIAVLSEQSGNSRLANNDIYLMVLGLLDVDLGNELIDYGMSDVNAALEEIIGGELND